jgi:hypothetical protein
MQGKIKIKYGDSFSTETLRRLEREDYDAYIHPRKSCVNDEDFPL